MAVTLTGAEIPTAEQNALSNDKPLFLSRNELRMSTQPRWTTDGQHGSADSAATGFESFKAYDNLPNMTTKLTTGVVDNLVHYNFLTNTSAEMDSVALVNHNLATIAGVLGGDITVTVQIDVTSPTPSGTFAEIHSPSVTVITTTSDPRLLILDLESQAAETPYRFTGRQYWRISFSSAGSDFSTTDGQPAFGQLYVGRRRQMGTKANSPFTEFNQISDSKRFTAKSGMKVDQFNNTGMVAFPRRHVNGFGVGKSGIDEPETLKSVWTDSKQGRNGMIYVEDPSTDPDTHYWMRFSENSFTQTRVGPLQINTSYSLLEQPPFLANE